MNPEPRTERSPEEIADILIRDMGYKDGADYARRIAANRGSLSSDYAMTAEIIERRAARERRDR